jgi:hypothetical protein
MLGERESNVVVKRADMTPEQLQVERLSRRWPRSRGRFPPGPPIRLPFGKQRSLGDFDELERQAFLREHALARQDQQTAKLVSDAMREHCRIERTPIKKPSEVYHFRLAAGDERHENGIIVCHCAPEHRQVAPGMRRPLFFVERRMLRAWIKASHGFI